MRETKRGTIETCRDIPGYTPGWSERQTASERIREARKSATAQRALSSARSAYPGGSDNLHAHCVAEATGLSVKRAREIVAADANYFGALVSELDSESDWEESAQMRSVVDPQDYDPNRWNLH